MVVKVCGITNLEDACAAVEAGATALGFNFWPKSPRYVEPERMAQLTAAVPAGVWKVGVFVDEPAEFIAGQAARCGLDIVQLHGGEAPGGVRLWRAVAVGDSFRMDLLDDPAAEAFLLDTPAGAQEGGTGRTFDWSRVEATSRRIVLAGGLDAANVARAIETLRPWGVDACSRLESEPGRKDHSKMRDFVKAALAAGAV